MYNLSFQHLLFRILKLNTLNFKNPENKPRNMDYKITPLKGKERQEITSKYNFAKTSQVSRINNNVNMVTPIHVDNPSAFLVLEKGKKIVTLYEPEETVVLKEPGQYVFIEKDRLHKVESTKGTVGYNICTSKEKWIPFTEN